MTREQVSLFAEQGSQKQNRGQKADTVKHVKRKGTTPVISATQEECEADEFYF